MLHTAGAADVRPPLFRPGVHPAFLGQAPPNGALGEEEKPSAKKEAWGPKPSVDQTVGGSADQAPIVGWLAGYSAATRRSSRRFAGPGPAELAKIYLTRPRSPETCNSRWLPMPPRRCGSPGTIERFETDPALMLSCFQAHGAVETFHFGLSK